MTAPTRIALVGALGRMGRKVLSALAERTDLRLTAALERPGASIGTDVGVAAGLVAMHVALSDAPETALAEVDVVVDFSVPCCAARLAPLCAQRSIAYLVASTNLSAADMTAVDEAAKKTPVLVAANLSLGINVVLALVEQAAAQLGEDFDIEIFEMHHRRKKDAPSGTALALAQAAKTGRPSLAVSLDRKTGTRDRGAEELGIASARGGDVSGDHTVFFLGAHERVEIVHRATDADVFAQGALRVADWLRRQRAGRYSVRDAITKAR